MFRTRSKYVSVVLKKKYFADPRTNRKYDFDDGIVGPTVVNNIIMPPQTGFGEQQHQQPGAYFPQQPGNPFAGAGGHGGQVPLPPTFG